MSEPLTPPGSLVQRILKNVAYLFGGKTSAVIIGLLVLAVAARALTVRELGALLLLHSFVAFVNGVASFKSWQALIHFGAKPIADNDITRLHELLRFTIGLDISAAVFASIFSVILYFFVYPMLGISNEVFLYGVAYCLLSAANFRSTPLGILRLYDRFDVISLHQQVVPIVRLIGATIGWLIGGSLKWFILTWFAAAAASQLMIVLLAIGELSRQGHLSGLFEKRPTLKAPFKKLWAFVLMSNIDATIDLSDKQLPTLLAGFLLGPSFAAVFKIARDVSDILAKGARQFDRVLYPELVRLMIDGQKSRAVRLITRSTLIMLLIGGVLAALVYIFGPGLFARALSPELASVANIATLLMIAAALLGATAPLYPALYALGEPGRASLARGITVGLMLCLFVGFAMAFGEVGPGWAILVAQAIGFILTASITFTRLNKDKHS